MALNLMTFNIQHARNFITGEIDLSKMAKTVKDVGGDIVSLNEVYGKGEGELFCDQAKVIAELLGDSWQSYFAPAIQLSKGPYGNAILSRYPILSAETVALPSPPPTHPGYYEDRCIVKAHIQTPEGLLAVLICHFGLQPEEAELAVTTLAALIDEERASDLPVVLMGDFNLTPNSPILEPLRQRMVDTDDFCQGKNLTFPSDEPLIKIDYIFVSPDVTVKEAVVPDIIAADHRTVRATVEL